MASAAPIQAFDLRSLAMGADVIVIGTVVSIADNGPTLIPTSVGAMPARRMVADVIIDNVVWGQDTSSIRFAFASPQGRIGYEPIVENRYRLFFLKRVDTEYQLVDPYHASVAAVPGTHLTLGNPLDRVLEALCHVLRSRNSSIDVKREAISQLRDMRQSFVVTSLRSGLKDDTRDVRMATAAVLLWMDDVEALSVAEAELVQKSDDSSEVAINLRAAVANGIKNTAAIPMLSRVLKSGAPESRRVAVAALRRMHATGAIGALSFALDDVDPDVQHEAVMGLAEIAHQEEWAPTAETFRMDRQRYVTYWKNWAQAR
jgi:hypothetical protein